MPDVVAVFHYLRRRRRCAYSPLQALTRARRVLHHPLPPRGMWRTLFGPGGLSVLDMFLILFWFAIHAMWMYGELRLVVVCGCVCMRGGVTSFQSQSDAGGCVWGIRLAFVDSVHSIPLWSLVPIVDPTLMPACRDDHACLGQPPCQPAAAPT